MLINDPLHWFRLVDVFKFNMVLRLWTDDLIRRRLDQPRQILYIAYDTNAARSSYKNLYLTVQAVLVEIKISSVIRDLNSLAVIAISNTL